MSFDYSKLRGKIKEKCKPLSSAYRRLRFLKSSTIRATFHMAKLFLPAKSWVFPFRRFQIIFFASEVKQT